MPAAGGVTYSVSPGRDNPPERGAVFRGRAGVLA